jgi:EPS-associated MarR family transcriptional regulator
MNEQMNDKPDILESEETLQLIKEIELNPKITQRDLAQRLEISLGKINFLINALIDKGIIEAKNFKNSKHKLGYMYLLTPHGIRIKLELVHKFLVWKIQEYKRLKQEIESLKKEQLLKR